MIVFVPSFSPTLGPTIFEKQGIEITEDGEKPVPSRMQ